MAVDKQYLETQWQKYPMRPMDSLRNGLASLCDVANKLYKEKQRRSIRVVCEVGSFAGESMVLICDKLRPEIYISIDPYANNYDETDWASQTNMIEVESVFEAATAYVNQQYGVTVLKIKGTIRDFHRLYPDIFIPVDMFYIDGSHAYVDVCTDIEYVKVYENYINEDSLRHKFILAGHDYSMEDVGAALRKHGYDIPQLMHFEDDSWLIKELL